MSLVECKNVSKTYRHRGRSVAALRGVSFSQAAGEFFAIRGKSGCGKSTFMLTLGGLQRPDAGEVRIQGQELYDLRADERAEFRAGSIGFVFQQFHLIPYLTVFENVLAARLGLARNGAQRATASSHAESLIVRMGLGERLSHKPAELSTGECQRVALARALMNGPRLIIADEPTGNLDETNTGVVLTALREIADAGTAVLLVTHDAQSLPYVDRVFQMEDGHLAS